MMRILICMAIIAAVHGAPVEFQIEKKGSNLSGGEIRVEGGGIRDEPGRNEEPLLELQQIERVAAGLRGEGIMAELERAKEDPELIEKEKIGASLRGSGIRDKQERVKEEPKLIEKEKVDAGLRGEGIRAEQKQEKEEPQPELKPKLTSEPLVDSKPQQVPMELPESEFEAQMQVVMFAMFADEDLPPQKMQRRDTVVGESRPVPVRYLEPGELDEMKGDVKYALKRRVPGITWFH